jgi:hypothetical protein
MAHHDLGDPWDSEFDPTRPSLQHKISSISDVSSQGSSVGSGQRGSVVSLLSETEGYRQYQNPYLREEVDISHVQVSPMGSGGRSSPVNRHSQMSMKLPDALRAGTPASSSNASSPGQSSYTPLLSSRRSSAGIPGSKRFSMKKKPPLLSRHGSIPEEEIDMSLLSSAMPMGMGFQQKTAYIREEEEEREDAPMVSPMANGYDISSFLGPMTDAQVKEANRQEANGILTGGLGAGWKAETTLTSTDLYASAPSTPISPGGGLSRKFTKRLSFRTPGLSRTPTLRDLAQNEANKRGKVVEVIIEEEPTHDVQQEIQQEREEEPSSPRIDLSSMEGGGSTTKLDFDTFAPGSRKGTLVPSKTEVFYPQDNWKPFSMRWPYLTALIVISVTLAVAQEVLYRRGALYTFNSIEDISTWSYFTFKYMPTLVAVSFGVLWQVTDFEVKRLEPYYQLSKEGGALAAESINVDYITFFNFFRPFKALRLKHYAVAISSIATLLAVSAVPTLQAASINLQPNRQNRTANPHEQKMIVIDPVYSRILSVILVLIAASGCVLVYQLQSRPSGLVADVKGIAGIAAMANRSHILMDFKNMDTASPEMIHKALKAHRYTLRNSSLAPEDKVALTQEEKDKYDHQQRRHQNPHPLMLRLVAGIPFVIGMMLFMIFVPIVIFDEAANVVTEKAPALLTILAVCIKITWGTLETDVRMIEPFYLLSKRHASPRVLTLDYSSMAFGWMPIRAFLNGHFLVGFVGLGSVLAEVLTVCATSFGNVDGTDFTHRHPDSEAQMDSGEETWFSFWVSLILALTILTFLCLVATFVYSRRRHPFLPRQPNTIASILAFIHQSKMLYDFVGTEKMNNDEMVERLVGIKKTYGLGWFTGRDGEMHCGVDEEELASDYKHGDDARKASMPWTTNWSDY